MSNTIEQTVASLWKGETLEALCKFVKIPAK